MVLSSPDKFSIYSSPNIGFSSTVRSMVLPGAAIDNLCWGQLAAFATEEYFSTALS